MYIVYLFFFFIPKWPQKFSTLGLSCQELSCIPPLSPMVNARTRKDSVLVPTAGSDLGLGESVCLRHS